MGDQGILTAAHALRIEAMSRDPWLARLRFAAIGWATVELERAAEELSIAFSRARLPEPDWSPAPRDALLGAAAWRSDSVSERWPGVILLEPDTEGRLAATLARFDEGVAAIYLEAPAGAASDPDARVTVDRARVGAVAAGPLGPSRLVLARPAWGPHVVVVTAPSPTSVPGG